MLESSQTNKESHEIKEDKRKMGSGSLSMITLYNLLNIALLASLGVIFAPSSALEWPPQRSASR